MLLGQVKLTDKKDTFKYDTDLQAKIGAWSTQLKGYYLLDDKSQVSNLTIEYIFQSKWYLINIF